MCPLRLPKNKENMVPFGCPTYLKTSCVWMPSCSWWPFAFHRMTTTQHTTRTSPSQPVNEEQDLMCPLRQTHYYTLRPPEVLREVNTASHVNKSELKGLDSYLLFIVPALIESRVTSASETSGADITPCRPAVTGSYANGDCILFLGANTCRRVEREFGQ